MGNVDKYEDVIDSRDVIERIEELEHEAIARYEEQTGTDGEDLPNDFYAAEYLDLDEAKEYEALHKLAEEAESYAADWRHGEALIRDSYFEDYARELAEDIGAISHDYSWPASHIDWSAAANALRQDYTSVDFDGVTYWIR